MASEVGPADRFTVLGVAPARTEWFRSVARWSNEAAVPVEFVKCISSREVESRLEQARPYSALLVDALTPGFDRDLIDAARSRGCAVIVVNPGVVDREWRALGVSGVLDERFGADDLMDVLRSVANPVGGLAAPADPAAHARTRIVDAATLAVTGAGGTGSSTIAMALAQGLAAVPEHRRLILVDMALRADQAMLHDVGDVVPALGELVEAHRLGVPEDDEIARLVYSVPDRNYHLLLGLRHPRDWMTIGGRALEATWTSLENLYTTVVVDIDDDFDGSELTGAGDLEDRNRLARTAARRARLVVAVGNPGTWGVRRLVMSILALVELGVKPGRILPCVNRGPRQPRARAEITRAIGDLLHAHSTSTAEFPSPIFVPDRRGLDDLVRDGGPLPRSLGSGVATPVSALMRHLGAPVGGVDAPIAIVPGSVGTWSDVDD